EVVGRTAPTDLQPGEIVTPDAVSDSATVPGAGQQLIGVPVKPGQLPAAPLQPRQPVLLVPAGVAGAAAEAWPPVRGAVISVFDPDGRHGRTGVFELMVQARTMPLHRAMSSQLLVLPDGTARHHLLPGVNALREAESLDWRRLTSLFLDLETVDVLADCGRFR